MRFFEDLASRTGIVGALFSFFWNNKWWWLTPMLLVLFIFGGLTIFAQSSAIAGSSTRYFLLLSNALMVQFRWARFCSGGFARIV